jgi:hypothetical protein
VLVEATLGTLGKPILGLTELIEPSCKFGRLGRPDLGLTELTELHVNSLNGRFKQVQALPVAVHRSKGHFSKIYNQAPSVRIRNANSVTVGVGAAWYPVCPIINLWISIVRMEVFTIRVFTNIGTRGTGTVGLVVRVGKGTERVMF